MNNNKSLVSSIQGLIHVPILFVVLAPLWLLLVSCGNPTDTSVTNLTPSSGDTAVATTPSGDSVFVGNPNTVWLGNYIYSLQSSRSPITGPFVSIHVDLILSHHLAVDTLSVHWQQDSETWHRSGDTVHTDTNYTLIQTSDTTKGLCGFSDSIFLIHEACKNYDGMAVKRVQLATSDSTFETYLSTGNGTAWGIPGMGIVKSSTGYSGRFGVSNTDFVLLSFNGTPINTGILGYH
jgi:hypothetical protein